MKILYIGPVRDFSGYANAARGYVRALAQAGADIVVRPVRYDRPDLGREYKPTDLEASLLSKPIDDGVDIVLQHVTPNEMRPVPNKTNIAVVAWETTKIPDYWAKKLNQFDGVITFCDASVNAFKNSGVTKPIFKIPHTFDMSQFDLTDIEEMSSEAAPDMLSSRYVFYNISQLSAKKGVDVLLRSYFAEFGNKEDKDKVILILKTYIDMQNRDGERERLVGYINNVKAAMRLPQDEYPPVMLITNTLTDEQVKKVHKTGDTYVCSSRGEGWCIPAFDALAYGNKLITTTWGGMGEFAVNNIGDPISPNVYEVNYSLEPLVGQNHADPDLYTAREKIAEPSVSSMMRQMRLAFDEQATAPAPEALQQFDYSKVGPAMLDVISKIANKELTNV